MVRLVGGHGRHRLTGLRGGSTLGLKRTLKSSASSHESLVESESEGTEIMIDESRTIQSKESQGSGTYKAAFKRQDESCLVGERKDDDGEGPRQTYDATTSLDATYSAVRTTSLDKPAPTSNGSRVRSKGEIRRDLMRKIQDLQYSDVMTIEIQGHIALLSGQLCDVTDQFDEAMQHYQSAFALYQEERIQGNFSGPLNERKIVLKMIICLQLLQRRCNKINDLEKVAKLGELIEILHQQSESLLLSHGRALLLTASESKLSVDQESLRPRSVASSFSFFEKKNSYSKENEFVDTFKRMNSGNRLSYYSTISSKETVESDDCSTMEEGTEGDLTDDSYSITTRETLGGTCIDPCDMSCNLLSFRDLF